MRFILATFVAVVLAIGGIAYSVDKCSGTCCTKVVKGGCACGDNCPCGVDCQCGK